jgi:AraC-like DNA-binding protein
LEWAMHHIWRSGESFNRHIAKSSSLWLVLKGSVHLSTPMGDWVVKAGDVFWHPPIYARDITAHEYAEWLSVGIRYDHQTAFTCKQPAAWTPTETEREMMECWMRQLVAVKNDKNQGSNLVISGLTQALLGIVINHTPIQPLAVPQWLDKVINTMQENPADTISACAESAGYSTAQFRHLFQKYIGISPRDYQQHCLLDSARHLLNSTELPVSAIADKLGFASHTQFTRFFKRMYGLSPTLYRQTSGMPQI